MPKIDLHEWYRQFQQLKSQQPDAILLYRLGDFYEAFDDDAKLIAALLDVTLTRKDYAVERGTKAKQYCPMAGVPYHAVERYVAQLVSHGYRVAIAEQVSETASSKSDVRPRSAFALGVEQSGRTRGVAHREVVRIVTPGTISDPAMLTAEQNTYLAAVLVAETRQGTAYGLAYVDLSTGEFAATELHGERATAYLEGELARLQVAEVLVPDDERARPAQLAPATATLQRDLAPMTKDERELLLPHERVARRLESASDATWLHGNVTVRPAWQWDAEHSSDVLRQQLGVQTLAGFGLADRPLAARAAGAVLAYVHDTQRSRANQITTLRAYTVGSFMLLDQQTRRNLELMAGSGGKQQGSLIAVLDQTRTPMGARLLRRWLAQPLLDLATLQARQAAVAAAVDDGVLRAEVRQALKDVGDMERAVNRVVQGLGFATPRDVVQVRQALRVLPQVAAAISGQAALLAPDMPHADTTAPPAPVAPPPAPAPAPAPEDDDDLFGEAPAQPAAAPAAPPPPANAVPTLDECADVLALLEQAIDDDPPALLGASQYLRGDDSGDKPRRFIRPGYAAAMDEVVHRTRDAQAWIDNLEQRERERTGIKSLKVDYNKVFGYYIEVSRAQSEQVPTGYERKQTLVSAERFITAELKEFEQVVTTAQQRLVELERDVFAAVCDQLAQHAPRLRAVAAALARLDVYVALAEVAARNGYTRPSLNNGTTLHIRGGRHPVVERTLAEPFVPNDLYVDTTTQQLLLITGPNMAGKSTCLRQAALIVLLAQIGSFVPADAAEIGLVDRIFTRIGAQDDIATGQSTFMVEMTETAALLAQSTRRSLIILDEVGRGTSTYDGMAIARALVEYIHDEPRLQCRTLFATHYHELVDLEQQRERVKNYHMAAVEQDGRVVFLYELRPGGADRSYGIHVAELAGIPRPVIARAQQVLAELEAGNRHSAPPTPVVPPAPTPTPEPAAPPAPEPVRGGQQLSLFEAAPSPVLDYLRRLDINALTPLEALNRLYEMQQLTRETAEH